jgi:hypothetical protein
LQEDHVEDEDEVTKKTKKFLKAATATWDAEFYVKVDDDVFVNIGKPLLAQELLDKFLQLIG